jgi:hypothetical protein
VCTCAQHPEEGDAPGQLAALLSSKPHLVRALQRLVLLEDEL